MIIALASPRVSSSLEDGLERVHRLMGDAAAQNASIVCFPEAYLPGLRGQDFAVYPFDRDDEARVVRRVSTWAREFSLPTIISMERSTATGPQIVAEYFDASGEHVGQQAKVQLDPSEEAYYTPGVSRRLFEVNGVRFGIAICHEGFRYPETVRWAAVRGAKIVFHPQLTGNEHAGIRHDVWNAASGPYYEKAMTMRALENTVYFASVNYALPFPEAATSIIDPQGRCLALLPYGQEGVLVRDIDLDQATGLLARRFAPDRY